MDTIFFTATLMEVPTDVTKTEPPLEDQPSQIQHGIHGKEGRIRTTDVEDESTPSPKRVRVEETD
jgi:hypothetical protein